MLKGHKESGLVTGVERRSGYLLAARVHDHGHENSEGDDAVIGTPPRSNAHYHLG
nr:hypothetical protein [Halomonas titanicae]